jgi:hypothetical protein
MSSHAPDIVMFDALDPLRYVGSEAVGGRAGQWLSWYRGPVGYEVRDLSVTAGRPCLSTRKAERRRSTSSHSGARAGRKPSVTDIRGHSRVCS